MVHLSEMPEKIRDVLLNQELPEFETTPWTDGPPLAERRSALGRGQRELQGAIQSALADPATQEEQFAQFSQRMLELQREGLQLQVWQRERLLEILNPRQVLRFMLLQEHLVRRIEEMRENRQQ